MTLTYRKLIIQAMQMPDDQLDDPVRIYDKTSQENWEVKGLELIKETEHAIVKTPFLVMER